MKILWWIAEDWRTVVGDAGLLYLCKYFSSSSLIKAVLLLPSASAFAFSSSAN